MDAITVYGCPTCGTLVEGTAGHVCPNEPVVRGPACERCDGLAVPWCPVTEGHHRKCERCGGTGKRRPAGDHCPVAGGHSPSA